MEVAVDVCLHRHVEAFFGQVGELFGVLLEGGVIDQDIEPPEAIVRLLGRIAAEGGVAHVAAQQQAALAFRFDIAFGVVRVLVFVQIDDGDVRAFARIQHRDRAADAGIAAGDQGHHACQLAAAGVVGCQKLGLELHLRLQPWLFQVLRGHRARILMFGGLHRSLAFARLAAR